MSQAPGTFFRGQAAGRTKAGDLKHRVRIEQRVAADNTRGEVVYTWATFLNLHAQKNPISGRDFFAAGQAQSDITTRWRIRYRLDIDTTMRLVELDGQKETYEIKVPPIEVDGGRQWVDLMCKAGVADER